VFLTPARTEVAFWHGMDRLVGDLVLPPWPGPHPAVLLARDEECGALTASWQRRLAAAGVASFGYDPAGTGRSTGDRLHQQVGDVASEILAAREVLTSHPDVAREAVALLAVGEAAWSGIRAEAFAKVFAGLVLLSTCVLDPVAVEQYRLGRRLERHGVGGDEIGLALTLLRERFRRAADGDDVDRVLQGEAACRSAPWYRLMPDLGPADVPVLARLVGVDPAAELAAVVCPVIVLNGAVDDERPVQRHVEAARRALREAGHADHACVVVPDADARLRDPDGDLCAGVPELVVTWLDRRLGRALPAPSRPPASGSSPAESSVAPATTWSQAEPWPVAGRAVAHAPDAAPEPVGADPSRPSRRAVDLTVLEAGHVVPAPSAPLSPPSFPAPVLPAPGMRRSRHAAEPWAPVEREPAREPVAGPALPAEAAPLPADELPTPTNGFFEPGGPLPPSVQVTSARWAEGLTPGVPPPVAPRPPGVNGGSPHDGAGRVDADGELRLPLTTVLPVIGRSYSS
jgi:uncharacterized protein